MRTLCLLLCSFGLSTFAAELPPVHPADLAQLKVADFADDELDLPYYLAHFHVLANAIVADGPERGAIHISLWRGTDKSYNARILENILSLAYFYCRDRPWNSFHADPALRARLEATLEFWCNQQNIDGEFSEYGPQQWNLPATAFATKFVGEALLLLHQRGAPPIDAAILARADNSLRRAIVAVLTLPALYEHGKSYTNQFGNVWGGALAYFSFHPDAELRALWEKRWHESRPDFQSPAGYYYERDGPDFGYTTTTHDHNVRQEWEWLRGSPLADEVIAKERPWFEWLAHNAVPEPDHSGFVFNRAIETRQKHTSFERYDTPLGEFIPLVRAFAESREERVARWKRERAELTANWPKVKPLPIGDFWAYTPYTFLHRRLNEWRPTTAERDAALKQLPMLARENFTRQFADSRKHAVFTFVRRPAYYATFNVGEKISDQQRYGLGLVWTPTLGAVLQSQTASDTASWGTRAIDAKTTYENASLLTHFSVAEKPIEDAKPGITDLAAGEFSARYALGERGEKTIAFADGAIRVSVSHPGEFVETLPLLVPPGGKIDLAAGRATLTTARGDCAIRFDDSAQAALNDASGEVLAKRIVVLTLRAKDSLNYTLGAAR